MYMQVFDEYAASTSIAECIFHQCIHYYNKTTVFYLSRCFFLFFDQCIDSREKMVTRKVLSVCLI